MFIEVCREFKVEALWVLVNNQMNLMKCRKLPLVHYKLDQGLGNNKGFKEVQKGVNWELGFALVFVNWENGIGLLGAVIWK